MEETPSVEEKLNFVHSEKVSKYLSCIICQDLFKDPMRLSCGHTFCGCCINSWLGNSRKNDKLCPMCRKVIDKNEISQDLMAYNLIGEIEVHCNNAENGCMWDGTIAELAEHLEECVYPPNKMPKWLKEHLQSVRKSRGIDLDGVKTQVEEEQKVEEQRRSLSQAVLELRPGDAKKLKLEKEQRYSDQMIEVPRTQIKRRKSKRTTAKKNAKKRKRHSQA